MDSKDSLHLCLRSKANVLKATGHPDEAMECLTEEEDICRNMSIPKELATNLIAQAEILILNPDNAVECFEF